MSIFIGQKAYQLTFNTIHQLVLSALMQKETNLPAGRQGNQGFRPDNIG
jgi:hypothetical protein